MKQQLLKLVKFKNGTYGVLVRPDVFLDLEKRETYWSTPEGIAKHCQGTLEQAAFAAQQEMHESPNIAYEVVGELR